MELEAAAPVPMMRRNGRKLARCPRLHLDTKTVTAIQQSTGETILDAAGEGVAGAMRVKIVLSKQQLKQVAAAVAGGGSFSLPPALEQLVGLLKQQHAKKPQASVEEEEEALARRRGRRWSPALQSIPEECFS
jgi:DNA-binding NarL/FixJ family response regulator